MSLLATQSAAPRPNALVATSNPSTQSPTLQMEIFIRDHFLAIYTQDSSRCSPLILEGLAMTSKKIYQIVKNDPRLRAILVRYQLTQKAEVIALNIPNLSQRALCMNEIAKVQFIHDKYSARKTLLLTSTFVNKIFDKDEMIEHSLLIAGHWAQQIPSDLPIILASLVFRATQATRGALIVLPNHCFSLIHITKFQALHLRSANNEFIQRVKNYHLLTSRATSASILIKLADAEAVNDVEEANITLQQAKTIVNTLDNISEKVSLLLRIAELEAGYDLQLSRLTFEQAIAAANTIEKSKKRGLQLLSIATIEAKFQPESA